MRHTFKRGGVPAWAGGFPFLFGRAFIEAQKPLSGPQPRHSISLDFRGDFQRGESGFHHQIAGRAISLPFRRDFH